ncbi:MAG: hypothetical protein WDA09_03460 [Bacteriovoracaceae bacterium]
MKIMTSILMSILLMSCGSEGPTKNKNQKVVNLEQQDPLIIEDSIDGQYLAKLLPMNQHISGPLDGAVTLSLDKDEFIGDVRFFGNPLTAETVFEQTVHIGNRCPTLADDLNEDGILDETEVLKVVDEVIIPLDGDLNSQWLGANTYPLADSFGSYYYSQVASFQRLLDDLWEIDINFEDLLVKLPKDTIPEFEGKIALIRGISKNLNLPPGVEFTHRNGVHASLPILCGVFQKVRNPPGRRNIDRYPYPHYEGENPDDLSTIGIPEDDTTPDYDIEPTGPILDYGS